MRGEERKGEEERRQRTCRYCASTKDPTNAISTDYAQKWALSIRKKGRADLVSTFINRL